MPNADVGSIGVPAPSTPVAPVQVPSGVTMAAAAPFAAEPPTRRSSAAWRRSAVALGRAASAGIGHGSGRTSAEAAGVGDGRVAAGDGVGSGVRTTASGDEPGVGAVDAARRRRRAAAAPHAASNALASTAAAAPSKVLWITCACMSTPSRVPAPARPGSVALHDLPDLDEPRVLPDRREPVLEARVVPGALHGPGPAVGRPTGVPRALPGPIQAPPALTRDSLPQIRALLSARSSSTA